MKSYPSINSSVGQNFREFDAYVFAKMDGSNLRFEWSRKNGWTKYGTRKRLFDETDEIFGNAIPLFHESWAKELHDIFKKQRYENAVAFMEFYGPNSFAGQHIDEDVKTLTLFDVAVHKKGILGPKEFVDIYGDLNIAEYLGRHNWTRNFVQRVRDGEFLDKSFEGVVGKTGEGHKLYMAKAKSQAWVDKVRQKYGDDAESIIMS